MKEKLIHCFQIGDCRKACNRVGNNFKLNIMNRLLLITIVSLITQFTFAQNAPSSIYEGSVIIDKPAPGGIGLKVEGGKTWLHNDDNGAESSVLELGIYEGIKTSAIQLYTNDDGGSNSLRIHSRRWSPNFFWSRGSNDWNQTISEFGGTDSYGQYLRLYGNAPDTDRVVKIELRTQENSFLNTNGNFGLGTNDPTEKLDVNGGGRFRNVPFGNGNILMLDGTGKLWQKTIPDFLYEHSLDGDGGLGDNLGNHTAVMDLDMAGVDVKNVKDIKGAGNLNMDAPGDISINSGDYLRLNAINGIDLNSASLPLLLNTIDQQPVGIGEVIPVGPLVPNDIKLYVNGRFTQKVAGNLGEFGPNDKWSSLGDSFIPSISPPPPSTVYGMINQGFGATFISGSKNGGDNIIGFSGNRLDFEVINGGNSPTIRASILKNGNMGIGGTPIYKLDVFGNTRTQGEHIISAGMMNELTLSSNDFIHGNSSIESLAKPIVINGRDFNGVGVGGVPNGIPGALNVVFDVHKNYHDAPVRFRELPQGNFPIVTVDDTGVLHKVNLTPYDLQVPPGGGDNLGNHQAIQPLDMNQNKIINLGDPVAPLDAANKAYVDAVATTPDANIMAIIAGLQAQIDELLMRVEALENE